MKILQFHKNLAKVVVENLDDLWCLSNIIDNSDIVEGRTFRKIKIGGEDERSQKVVKKPVFLKIGVEKVEFHRYSDVLRVSGKVVEGKEDIPKSSYHTFNVEQGSNIVISKTEWLGYHRKRLNESAKEKQPDTLVCVFDREEAYIAIMKKYGFELLVALKGDVAKKSESGQAGNNFYDTIISSLNDYAQRYSVQHIILASPAFWKDELFKRLKDKDLKEKIVVATCSSCDKTAINEVLKRPEVLTVLQKDRISSEMRLVEELLSEISKDGVAAYGMDDTETAVNAGSARVMLVTDNLIHKKRQEDDFKRLNNLMKIADKREAEIHIISSEHDGGKKLDGLGGIGALLRYKMNY
ncbi:mRNA surveillance protein pelota [Candidatus Woesearchaeota archaeon]|nr:mRNA surveillance protein pelota [Candidatus Woesearchaeota archaeon]